jgi:dTDP-4-dehydrorhamnose reductase
MVNFKESKILFTGGSGLLGGEMKKLIPKALFPTSKVLDVTNYRQMEKYFAKHKPQIVIHAAAFTSPPKIEKQPEKALHVNLMGTAYLTDVCFKYNSKMVYICTDYVYPGNTGNYKETDPVLPVNKYAWSKLGGECAVRLMDNALILRIAMGEKVFPHPRAFVDHITSRETADVIAKKILNVVKKGANGVFNLGTKGRSVYKFAKGLKGKMPIGKISIKEVNFVVPHNTSFNTSKYAKLMSRKKMKSNERF